MPATTPATSWRVLGWSGAPKESAVHRRDRTRAHGEDIAQDAADTGGRALIGLNVGRVVVAFHLEHHRLAVADVDDTGILARAANHLRAGSVGRVRSHFFEDL